MTSGELKGIVFFDGVCGLCNTFVNFLFRRKNASNFRYATLQGQKARSLLPAEHTTHLSSVVYYRKDKIYTKSGAVLRILSDLGGIWTLSKVLLIIPAFLSNAVYDFIASNRYKWFGKKETCRIPTPEERRLFDD